IWRGTPGPVASLGEVAEVAVGRAHSCARLGDGSVWCWGANDYGQLGDGTMTARVTPTRVAGLSDVTQVSTRNVTTCALRRDGSIRCWGNPPGVVDPGVSDAAEICVSGAFGCARLADGTVRCWGSRGDSPRADVVRDVVALGCGDLHACATT